VIEKRARVQEGRILEYRVRLRLSFDMAPETVLHW
jgi:flavin-binding protein dodecin